MVIQLIMFWTMSFPNRLADLRKQRGFTQQALSELVGVKVLQIHRYESGASQPTLEVIKKLATALSVSTDELLFDKEERALDQDLHHLFEGVSRLTDREKQLVKEFVEGMLVKHELKRWTKDTSS